MAFSVENSVRLKLEMIAPNVMRTPHGAGYMGTFPIEPSEEPYRDAIFEMVREHLLLDLPWLDVQLTSEGISCSGLNI